MPAVYMMACKNKSTSEGISLFTGNIFWLEGDTISLGGVKMETSIGGSLDNTGPS